MRHSLLIAPLLLAGSLTWAAEAPHEAAPMMFDKAEAQARDAATMRSSLASFRSAYAAAGKPRLAVYFNRELSDEIEEWKTPVRVEHTSTNLFGDRVQSETAVHFRTDSGQTHSDLPNRMTWALEQGFYQAFSAEKARLVDRKMMLRLAAAKRPENGKAMVAVRHVETDALKGHADILIELLIEAQPGSKSGYNFRAQATSVKTAQIIAMVNADDLEPVKGRFVAGPNGYERVRASADPAYARDLGKQLAQRLMVEMANGL